MFNKTVKNLNRLREVIQILFKYGFEEVIATTTLKRLIPAGQQAQWQRYDKPVLGYSRWERLRMATEELGPTFVKMAQFLSNRPDLLPEALIKEFEKLQNEVPAMDAEQVIALIEKETGKKINELFSSFSEQTLGSASIGQVHRATLFSGEEVAVKVQRPQARAKINSDLSLLRELVRLTENQIKKYGILNPGEVVEAFEKSMLQELDYTIELRHMEQFRKVYVNETDFYIPRPYKQYSTEKILISEYIAGCKITDVPQLEAWGLDPQKIVEKGLNIYLRQMFEFGFFHADPHPGNILVQPDGRVVLIDFGMAGKLLKQQRYAFANVFVGIANQNPKSVAVNLRKLASQNEIDSLQEFEDDLNELIENFMVYDFENAGISQFTAQLQKIIYKYKLQVPGAIFLILRALAILEGIGKLLHPRFEAFQYIRPYGFKIIAEQFSFKNQRTELTYSISQLISLMYIFPAEVKNILKMIRGGDLNLNLILKGFEQYRQSIDRTANKYMLAFLTGIFWLSSALALPHQPQLAYAGFSFSLLLGLVLLVYTFWRKKEKEEE